MLSRDLVCLFACAWAAPGCSLLFAPGEGVAGLQVDAAGAGDAAADSTPLDEWFDQEAKKRLEFVIVNQSNEELVDFPVLVRLASPTLEISELDNSFVVVDDGALVNYQIDTAETERSTRRNFWFKATLPPSSSSTYQLYYDFDTPPEPTDSDGVFAAYVAVWHMQAQGMTVPSAAATPGLSATLNTGNSTEEGLIGAAITSASGSALTTSSVVSSAASCLSISAWVRPAAQDNALRSLYDSKTFASNGGVLLSYQDQTTGPQGVLESFAGMEYKVANLNPPSPQLTALKWHHLALRIDGREAQLVVNGSDFPPSMAEASDSFDLNGIPPILGGDLNGTMDEVRVSTRCLSAKWMRAEYLNVVESFVNFRDPETRL